MPTVRTSVNAVTMGCMGDARGLREATDPRILLHDVVGSLVEETLELFAFMSAADESKAKGGVPIRIDEVMKKAQAEVEARTAVKKK